LSSNLFIVSLAGADVSKRKDGGIMKSTLLKGKGQEMPNDGATCEGNIDMANLSHLTICCA